LRAVIQRVKKASVTSGDYHSQISEGLLVLLAVAKDDTEKDISYLIDKTGNLRIFSDSAGKLNLSVKDIKGAVLAVSQFTLYGDCRKGRRPSFENSAGREKGLDYFNKYVQGLRKEGLKTETGMFGEDMKVELLNDGPVTIILDSKNDNR
jgi:D-tyrosyl-tRNA(Tyr) deacylase